jgi:hypothetical protein
MTLATIVAGRPPLERPGQHRKPRGNAGDSQPVAGPLDQQLVTARPRWRQEHTVRIVRACLEAAEDADQAVHPVIVRLEVVVADRPVGAQAVETVPAKVVRPETERDAAPMVGAAAQHPGAPPVELGSRRPGVGFTFDLPPADAGVELAEGPLPDRGAASRRLVRPAEHRPVGRVVPRRPRLEQHDVRPGLGEDICRHAAAGPRADDADVVDLPPGRQPAHPRHTATASRREVSGSLVGMNSCAT